MKFRGTVQRQFTPDEHQVWIAILTGAAAVIDDQDGALADRIRLAAGDDRKLMFADPVAWYERQHGPVELIDEPSPFASDEELERFAEWKAKRGLA
jgi:hypothetical protein